MTMGPIVFRELRVQARRAATYGMRVAGVLAGVVVFCVLCFAREFPVSEVGGRLFMSLHGVTLIFIWLAVPLSISDCIARERREGTFGLLFLTPLRPTDVLAGKLLVHFLAAMTLWVSILPVMIIPFLLGGVTGLDVSSAVILQGTSIVVGLAAGLLASVLVQDLKWASGLALLIASLALSAMVNATVAMLVRGGLTAVGRQNIWLANGTSIPVGADGLYWLGLTNWQATWASHLKVIGLTGLGWMTHLRNMVMGGAGFALLAVGFCSLRIRRLSRDQTASRREIEFEANFCQPTLWKGFFRERMKGSLNRNPIGWLQVRSVSGRLTMWIWMGVVILLETYSMIVGYYAWYVQPSIGLLLVIGLAFSSATSFRNERLSGALELILVTPIREGTLFWGRLRGIWFQFFPAVSLYVLTDLAYPWDHSNDFPAVWLIVTSYLGLPVVGMLVSLTPLNPLMATLLTAVGWLGLPLGGRIALAMAEFIDYSIFVLVGGDRGTEQDTGFILRNSAVLVFLALLGLVLYYRGWAVRTGRRMLGVVLVITGVTPFIAAVTHDSWVGWMLISGVLAVVLVLESGHRLHRSLRERRFMGSH